MGTWNARQADGAHKGGFIYHILGSRGAVSLAEREAEASEPAVRAYRVLLTSNLV